MGLEPAAARWQTARINADLLQPFPQAAAQGRRTAIAKILGLELQQLVGLLQLLDAEQGCAEGKTAPAAAARPPEAVGGEGFADGGMHLPGLPAAPPTALAGEGRGDVLVDPLAFPMRIGLHRAGALDGDAVYDIWSGLVVVT